jgi:AraC-like DNA-binding protein
MKQKKLQFARKEILEGKSISEVSHLTGFSDASAFSKSFRQVYGFNPGILKKEKSTTSANL